MTRVEIVVVAIRLLAVWVLFAGVSVLIVSIVNAGNSIHNTTGIAAIVLGIFLGLFGLVWKFSAEVAGWVLPVPPPEPAVNYGAIASAQRVGLRVIGVYMVALGLSGVGYAVVYGVAIGGDDPALATIQAQGAAELARMMVLLVFGSALFLGREGLQRILDRFRGADVYSSDTPES
jgi:hypothetical protein